MAPGTAEAVPGERSGPQAAQLVGQHPKAAVELHVLVDPVDGARPGRTSATGTAGQTALGQILLHAAEGGPEVRTAILVAARRQKLCVGDRGWGFLVVLFEGQRGAGERTLFAIGEV